MIGAIWVVLFFVLMAVVLFNMILAIIFDVYSDVKSGAGDAESIFEQAYEMYKTHVEKMKAIRAASSIFFFLSSSRVISI